MAEPTGANILTTGLMSFSKFQLSMRCCREVLPLIGSYEFRRVVCSFGRPAPAQRCAGNEKAPSQRERSHRLRLGVALGAYGEVLHSPLESKHGRGGFVSGSGLRRVRFFRGWRSAITKLASKTSSLDTPVLAVPDYQLASGSFELCCAAAKA